MGDRGEGREISREAKRDQGEDHVIEAWLC